MRLRHTLLVLVVVIGPLGLAGAGAPLQADLILTGGKVVTVDKAFSIQEAVAIRGNRILATGSAAEIAPLRGAGTQVVDLHGHTVMPGLIDTHLHQIGAGLDLRKVQLDTARTMDEFLGAIAARVKTTPRGQWIITSGRWFETNLKENRLPTRQDLDKVAPDNPVRVERGHASIFNSFALRLGKVTRASEPPEGGEIRRDENGEPNGILLDRAVGHFFGKLLPPEDRASWREALSLIQKQEHAYGLTSVVDPGLSPEQMLAYQDLRDQGRLTMRTGMMLRIDPTQPLEAIQRTVGAFPLRQRFGDEQLWVHGIKMGIDGGPHNALLREEYANRPGYSGMAVVSTQKLTDVVTLLNDLDWRVGIHCVGDAAIDSILTAYEAANRRKSIVGKRWELIHAILPARDHYDRVDALQLNVTTQTMHNWSLGANMVNNWGKARANQTEPVRTWIERLGVRVSGGTDGGTFPFDQMLLLWMELTRQTEGAGVLGAGEAVTREQAIRFHTINGAYATFDEEQRGSLEPGKLADLIVLSGDILTVPTDDIRALKVLATMVGGKVVHGGFDFVGSAH